MKNLILKLLGLDQKTVESLRSEVDWLKTTLATLRQESTEVYNKTEQAFIIIKELGIDQEKECWWEDDNINFRNLDHNSRMIAYNIQKSAMKEWVRKNPSLLVRKTFHGGCLGCITPLEKGIGTCLGCHYANFNQGYPDLSKQKNNN